MTILLLIKTIKLTIYYTLLAMGLYVNRPTVCIGSISKNQKGVLLQYSGYEKYLFISMALHFMYYCT